MTEFDARKTVELSTLRTRMLKWRRTKVVTTIRPLYKHVLHSLDNGETHNESQESPIIGRLAK